jgi:hypothetical protein
MPILGLHLLRVPVVTTTWRSRTWIVHRLLQTSEVLGVVGVVCVLRRYIVHALVRMRR